jgi:hypothetical protein
MKNPRPIDEPRKFDIKELFFSTTDLNGKLTSWNNVFENVAAYEGNFLINKPHSIVRHPDMPKGVFQLLWDLLEDGQTVGAYVKNLAADGRYYWVYALALPINNGYLSIRLKPTSKFFDIIYDYYPKLLEFEKQQLENGVRPAEVAKISKIKLLEDLKSLGFDNYRSFMQATLPSEIFNREKEYNFVDTIDLSKGPSSTLYGQTLKFALDLEVIYKVLSKSSELSKKIDSNFKETSNLALEIKRGALNATIEATKLGQQGDALYVLADYLGINGRKTIEDLNSAEDACQKSLSSVDEVLLVLCIAKLQTEMLVSFLKETTSKDKEESTLETKTIMTVDRTKILLDSFSQGVIKMVQQYGHLESVFKTVTDTLNDLKRLFLSLKIAHVSARTVSSRIDNAARFGQVFDEVCSVVDHGRGALDSITTQLEVYVETLKSKKENCIGLQFLAEKLE